MMTEKCIVNVHNANPVYNVYCILLFILVCVDCSLTTNYIRFMKQFECKSKHTPPVQVHSSTYTNTCTHSISSLISYTGFIYPNLVEVQCTFSFNLMGFYMCVRFLYTSTKN